METFQGNISLKLFLSKTEKELFEIPKMWLSYSNFTKEEWEGMCSLTGDRSVVINEVDKGSCVVVWVREDYIAEAEKQISDKNVYKEAKFKISVLQDLTETSNDILKSLRRKGKITEDTR